MNAGKVPCRECGILILAATAAANEGRCMPCRRGVRASMAENRRRHQARLERSRTDPARLYWLSLLDRVFRTPEGFSGLSSVEQRYYVACCLQGEVYNGGLEQFFSNNAGTHYAQAVEILGELDAGATLDLLIKAKQLLFGERDVPEDTTARRDHICATETEHRVRQLDELDAAYYADPDGLDERIRQFAARHSLYRA